MALFNHYSVCPFISGKTEDGQGPATSVSATAASSSTGDTSQPMSDLKKFGISFSVRGLPCFDFFKRNSMKE